ncbi:NEL-type E3 ubiquitin ligase domain-containing protein [Pseudomonas sp. LB3P81]
MYRQRAAQVLADSRLLVVPTDDEDEKTRLARLEAYEDIGINIALFFASFVPVLGEVMFAVAGFQLLQGIYEGIDSWAKGEQEQATDYFFDTLENLILMTALSAGTSAAGKAYKAVRTSSFVQGLRAVPVSSGSVRLWKPDLSAYRRPLPIRSEFRPDEQGLVLRHGHRYLPIGTDGYAVRPVHDTGLWEIQSPESFGRYSPVLETNGAGAWRHASELPQDWNLLTLFRRMGYRKADVSDAQALQILAAIGVDEKPLRQLYVDRRKPMATLIDTARRFRADGDTGHFIEQMRTPASAPYADADLQLYLLTSLGKWPGDAAVSITNIVGDEVTRYGSGTATRTIKISQDLLRKGQFHPPLLAALNAQERSLLLGSATAGQPAQTTLLTGLIAEHVERFRLPLFDRLFRRADTLKTEKAAPIREAFTELPASVADELVEYADLGEWQELEAGRVPLRLAEEARRYVQVLRLNRAYEGLYLDATNDQGAHLLVLDALEHLPGWPKDVSVQIMEWAVHSDEKPSIGPNDAVHEVFIDAHPDRYEATDAQGKVLFSHPGRTRQHFFQTLWESLPVQSRKSLGVEADDAGAGLRQKITALALQRRDAIAKKIGIVPLRACYRSPMGLADWPIERSISLALPDPKTTAPRSPALLQRARELYPTHSPAQIERFLVTIGTDEVLALRALESLRLEYQSIRNTLEHWVHRDSHYQVGDGPRLKVPGHSKSRAAQAILRAWRKETDLTLEGAQGTYHLAFDAQPLGDMPVIVGGFSHIDTLEMNKVGGSAGLNAFLRNFTHLHALSLTGNELTRIPQAVADMPNLTRLDLSDNQIYLTPESITSLGSNTHLHSLNLSFNPALGRVPTVTSLRELRHLALRGTGIVEWPEGVTGLPDLQTMDLRDNAIVQIPKAVFEARSPLNFGTSVDGNPLSSSSLQAIASYQQSHGINLGVITADYRPAARRVIPDPRGSSWMTGLSKAQITQRQALWLSLSAYPNSGDFFYLLGQLLNTADFARLPGDLSRRVGEVLEAAGEDDTLRRSLFRISRLGRVSADDPARLFSNLEVRVLCFRAMAAARTGIRSLEGELVHLMRGLFRLQEVERQALMDVAERILSGSVNRGQAHELSLAYRVGLAQRLDLPAQPREINVRLDVEVSTEQLEHAYQEIVKAETPTAVLGSHTQGFWYEYLQATYQHQFSAISERTTIALVKLEAQVDLPRATATQRLKAIIENDKNENRELIKRLTDEALARHPGLATPDTSVRSSNSQGVDND